MHKIYVPSAGPISWKTFLADPEKQWKAGYSAHAMANAWEAANGQFPADVERIFASSGDKRVENLELLMAFPEWKVYLPPRGHPSQNDLFVLARNEQGLVSIMVEGKVSEPFGPTIAEWLRTPTPGKLKRLAFLQSKLGLEGELPETIRYQLLHRTVSAIMEAERFCAGTAVMLVHSFSPDCLWLEDFQAFLGLFATESVNPGQLYLLSDNGGVALFAGWVAVQKI